MFRAISDVMRSLDATVACVDLPEETDDGVCQLETNPGVERIWILGQQHAEKRCRTAYINVLGAAGVVAVVTLDSLHFLDVIGPIGFDIPICAQAVVWHHGRNFGFGTLWRGVVDVAAAKDSHHRRAAPGKHR